MEEIFIPIDIDSIEYGCKSIRLANETYSRAQVRGREIWYKYNYPFLICDSCNKVTTCNFWNISNSSKNLGCYYRCMHCERTNVLLGKRFKWETPEKGLVRKIKQDKLVKEFESHANT